MADGDWANIALNSATFVAALGAVYFSHRSLEIQRRQKLADYRKEWIEDLRAHLADFSAAVYRRKAVTELYEFTKEKGAADMANDFAVQHMEFTESIARLHSYVRLQLNEDEPEHKALLDLMSLYRKQKFEEIDNSPVSLNALAKAVLKKEWERLKREL